MAPHETKQESAPSAPSTGPAVKQESQPDAEQFAEFLKWKEQQEKAKKEDSRDKNPGSPKKTKMDDSELELFKLQLAELSLQWDEMEPELRDKLRLSEQARQIFWPCTGAQILQPMIRSAAASQRRQPPREDTILKRPPQTL